MRVHRVTTFAKCGKRTPQAHKHTGSLGGSAPRKIHLAAGAIFLEKGAMLKILMYVYFHKFHTIKRENSSLLIVCMTIIMCKIF
jgi:hypothetical protein